MTALKLPGFDRGRATRRATIPEDTAQTAVVLALRRAGYTVLVTSRRRKGAKCRKCGTWAWPEGGDGVDKGLADLSITHDDWPFGMAYMLEVKGTLTAISPEQADLARRGRIGILRAAHSLEWTASEALRMVREAEARIRERATYD